MSKRWKSGNGSGLSPFESICIFKDLRRCRHYFWLRNKLSAVLCFCLAHNVTKPVIQRLWLRITDFYWFSIVAFENGNQRYTLKCTSCQYWFYVVALINKTKSLSRSPFIAMCSLIWNKKHKQNETKQTKQTQILQKQTNKKKTE